MYMYIRYVMQTVHVHDFIIIIIIRSLDGYHQNKILTRKGQRQKSSSSSLTKKTGSGNSLQSMAGHSPMVVNRERSGSTGLGKEKGSFKGGGIGGMVLHSTETVVITDICDLLPIDYDLAKSYR